MTHEELNETFPNGEIDGKAIIKIIEGNLKELEGKFSKDFLEETANFVSETMLWIRGYSKMNAPKLGVDPQVMESVAFSIIGDIYHQSVLNAHPQKVFKHVKAILKDRYGNE